MIRLPHAECTYDMTGPEVIYRKETVEEAYASRAHYGAPAWQVDAWMSAYTAIASGELNVISDSVRDLVDMDTALASPSIGPGGRHPLPHPEVFEAAMRAAGVSNDQPVVIAAGPRPDGEGFRFCPPR